MAKYWEDYKVGEKFETPGRTAGEGMINTIAGLAGYTLPIFWDEEEAKRTEFKTRIAPGRLTLLLMGALDELAGFWDPATIIAVVGYKNIQLKAPLRMGDTIRVEAELTEKRETAKPSRGIIICQTICKNQRGEILIEIDQNVLLVKRRPNP